MLVAQLVKPQSLAAGGQDPNSSHVPTGTDEEQGSHALQHASTPGTSFPRDEGRVALPAPPASRLDLKFHVTRQKLTLRTLRHHPKANQLLPDLLLNVEAPQRLQSGSCDCLPVLAHFCLGPPPQPCTPVPPVLQQRNSLGAERDPPGGQGPLRQWAGHTRPPSSPG